MATTAVSDAAELDEQRLAARYGVRWWVARSDELLDDLESLNIAGERGLPRPLRDRLDELGVDLLRLTREARRPERPEPFGGASVTEALDHVFDDLQELALDMLQPERGRESDYTEADLVLWAQVCRALDVGPVLTTSATAGRYRMALAAMHAHHVVFIRDGRFWRAYGNWSARLERLRRALEESGGG
jgi:hypothetical protein